MKRVVPGIMVAVLIVSLMVSCSAPEDDADRKEIARRYIDAFISQDYRELGGYSLTFRMRWSLNNSVYKQIKEQLEKEFGAYVEKLDAYERNTGEYITVTYICRFSEAYGNLNVVFDQSNRIAGFNYTYNKTYMENDKSIDVVFGTEFNLPGSLLVPDSSEPVPAVIFVHGSGPGNRNGEFGGNAVYFDIATGLLAKGIASLRYDKRTLVYAGSGHYDMETFTVYDETIDDVVSAFRFLSVQPGIDPDEIYIIGHSMGGYLMPRIADEIPDAAGFVMMAPNASPLEEIMVRQVRYISESDGNISRQEKKTIGIYEQTRDLIKNLTPVDEYESSELFNAPLAYWLDLRDYKPLLEIKDEQRPILIIHGSRDYQVDMTEYEKWNGVASAMENAESVLLEGLNHMMAYGEEPSTPQEYYELSEVDERVTDGIADFINGE